ncbi:MAG: hypothetical protein JSS87_12390 [Acidobacteria bacterium]|nr:hypothetical protein [Acidobacteriota bacterium]
MATLSSTDKRNMVRLLWGTFLCALLFVFAMAAKTALYQTHHNHVQSLTAAKVWSGKESIPASAAQAQVLPAASLAACVIVLFAAPQRRFRQIYRKTVRVLLRTSYSPPLDVRPPPLIQ